MAEGENENPGQEREDRQGNRNLSRTRQALIETFGDLTGTFASGIPTISDVMGALGGIGVPGENLVKHMEGQVQTYQRLSRSGLDFGGDIIEMGLAATRARMNLDQMAAVGEENSQVFAALGGLANEGFQQFLTRTAQFYDQPELVNPLRNLGMSFEEINENLLIFEQISARTTLKDQRDQATRLQAAQRFSVELDAIAKLTGKQADQLRAEMNERMREGRIRAVMMGMTAETAEAFELFKGEFDQTGFGPVFDDLVTMGTVSKENAALAAAAGPELMAQMRQAADSFRNNTATVANTATMRSQAMATASERMTSAEFRRLAALQGLGGTVTAFGDALERGGDAALATARIEQDLSERLGRRATAEEVAAERTRRAAAAQAEQQTGEDPGQIMARGIMGVQTQLAETAEQVQVQAVQRILEAVTPALDAFNSRLAGADVEGSVGGVVDAVSDAINTIMGPMEQQRMNTLAGRLNASDEEGADAAAQELAAARQAVQDSIGGSAQQQAAAMARLEEARRSARSLLGDEDVTSNVRQMEVDNLVVTGTFNAEPNPNNSGTIGSTGSMVADFGDGTLATLHGREAVLNMEQLENLARGIGVNLTQAFNAGAANRTPGSSVGVSEAINNIAPIMQRSLGEIRPAMERVAGNLAPQLQGMVSNIRREMPTPTTGGEMPDLTPIMESLRGQAESMRQPMQEIAEQLRGPMQEMAGTMQRQLGVSTRSLRATKGLTGNVFRGF